MALADDALYRAKAAGKNRCEVAALDDTLWFNGFVAYGGGLGWWDIYSGGAVVGVVEWLADGQGGGQFGIAALAGSVAGDALYYLKEGDTGYVGYYDASLAFEAHVAVEADHSGDVMLPDYNGGEPACWDTTFADVACE